MSNLFVEEPLEEAPKAPKKKRLLLKIGLPLVIIIVLIYSFTGGSDDGTGPMTFEARRGTLDIKVLEGGQIDALQSQRIKSEIRGETKILQIIEEGYSVTEEDVNSGKILVKFDDSKIVEDLTQQEIQYQGAEAGYTEAKEQFAIQIKENESSLKSAELVVKFARMDLQKYVGAGPAEKLLAFLDEEVNSVPAPIISAPATDNYLNPNSDKTDIDSTAPEVAPGEPGDRPRGERRPRGENTEGGEAPRMREGGEGAPADGERPRRRRRDTGEEGAAPAQQSMSTTASLDNQLAAAPPQPDVVKEALEAAKSAVEDAEAAAKPAAMVAPQDADGKVALQSDVKVEPPARDLLSFVDIKSLEGEAEQMRRDLESKRVVAEQETLLAKNRLEWTKKLREKNFVTQSELESDEMKVLQSDIGLQSSNTAEDLFIQYEFPKQVEKLSSDYQEALRTLDVKRRQAVSQLAQAEARLRSSEATYSLQKRRRDELREQLSKCEIKAERVGLVVYAGSNRQYRGDNQQIEEGATVREQQEIITIPDMKEMAVTVKVHESVVKQVQRGQTAKIRLDAYSDETLEGEVSKVSVLPDSSMRWMNPELKLYPTTVTIDGMYDWLKPGMSAQVEIMVKSLPNVIYIPIQAVSESGGKRVVYVSKTTGYEKRPIETGEFNQEFIEVKSGLTEGEFVLLRAPEEERLKEQKNESAEPEKPADDPTAPPAAPPANGGGGGGGGNRGNGGGGGQGNRGGGQ